MQFRIEQRIWLVFNMCGFKSVEDTTKCHFTTTRIHVRNTSNMHLSYSKTNARLYLPYIFE